MVLLLLPVPVLVLVLVLPHSPSLVHNTAEGNALPCGPARALPARSCDYYRDVKAYYATSLSI